MKENSLVVLIVIYVNDTSLSTQMYVLFACHTNTSLLILIGTVLRDNALIFFAIKHLIRGFFSLFIFAIFLAFNNERVGITCVSVTFFY